MDVGPSPQPDHIAVRDTTGIPAITNSVVTVMSVGRLGAVVDWSMLSKQLSRGKKALICALVDFTGVNTPTMTNFRLPT